MRMIMTLFCVLTSFTGCDYGPWEKDNKKKEVSMTEKMEIIKVSKDSLCLLALEKYLVKDRFHQCDSALFAGLLGTACGGVDISAFEDDKTGRMCRDWECSCWDEVNKKDNGSDSDYSKDMNTGVQHYLAAKPDKDLTTRIVDYLADNKLVMCEAKDEVTQISKCLMPPDTYATWQDMLKNSKSAEVKLISTDLYGRTGYRAHLAVIGILTEGLVYGGISDISLKELKEQAEREPENALYVAAHALYENGSMERAADLWQVKIRAGSNLVALNLSDLGEGEFEVSFLDTAEVRAGRVRI